MVISCPNCHGMLHPNDQGVVWSCEDCHKDFHGEYLVGFVAGKMSAAKAMEKRGTAHNSSSPKWPSYEEWLAALDVEAKFKVDYIPDNMMVVLRFAWATSSKIFEKLGHIGH